MSAGNVYVLGLASHPAVTNESSMRLEEMVYHTSHAALESANVSRRQLDSVTLGACDELDGRCISSMLMAAPAGAYLSDEIKVTDAGAMALCLAYARMLSGDFHIGLVASWCKSSKTDADAVMRLRGDPFFSRPLGINGTISDALFAQAVGRRYEVTEDEANRRVLGAYQRAAKNPRGMRHDVPALKALQSSPYRSTPLRSAQIAPLTDGAVSIVIASDKFLQANPQCAPMARIAGVGWASDSYRLDAGRLGGLKSATAAWQAALARAGLNSASDLDAIELESPTGWHEAAYVRAFDIEADAAVSPSGGSFAQNPSFCAGLINAAEAVLQVAGRAGAVQLDNVRRAAAHSQHGYAQQGNIAMIFERPGGAR